MTMRRYLLSVIEPGEGEPTANSSCCATRTAARWDDRLIAEGHLLVRQCLALDRPRPPRWTWSSP
jgi:hypothetical protein